MRTKESIIKDIYWQTWYFSYHGSLESIYTELSDDPGETAKIIKTYCEVILESKEGSKVSKNAISEIIKLSTPENIEKPEPSRLEYMPRIIASNIKSYCEELIDICNSLDDTSLQRLNKKWTKKYLYFNGDESGQQIIYPEVIHYNGDDLVFDGILIDFRNTNNDNGYGVIVSSVKNFYFDSLYYIDHLDDIQEKKMGGDAWDLEPSPELLDAELSSAPIDTNLTSRELTKKEVDKMIQEWITHSFEYCRL